MAAINRDKITKVIIIISPVIIGLLAYWFLVALPSNLVDILYWIVSAIMLAYWPWAGMYFARHYQGKPAWRTLLIGNSGVLTSAALSIIMLQISSDNAIFNFIHKIAQAYTMPLLPFVSGLWLLNDTAHWDPYAPSLLALGCALLLVALFAAGYAYRRLNDPLRD